MEIATIRTTTYVNNISRIDAEKVQEEIDGIKVKDRQFEKKHKAFPLEQQKDNEMKLDDFFQGKITIEELKTYMQNELEKMRLWYIEDGFIEKKNSEAGTIKYLQRQFKGWKISAMYGAIRANDIEGIEVAKKNGFRHGEENMDYLYYNAEYYYKWEEVEQIINECIEEKAKELGIDNLDKHGDWEEDMSFNKAWNSGKKFYGKMINSEAVPPRDFVFFYREEYSEQLINEGSRQKESIFVCNRRMIVNGLDVMVSDKSDYWSEKQERLYKFTGAAKFYEENYKKDGMKVAGPGFLSNFMIRYLDFEGISRIETRNFTFNNTEYYFTKDKEDATTTEEKFEYEFLKNKMHVNNGLIQKLRETE